MTTYLAYSTVALKVKQQAPLWKLL